MHSFITIFRPLCSVLLCGVWLLPSFYGDISCMELASGADLGDLELSVCVPLIKGPPPTLRQRAATAVVQGIAQLSKIDQGAARKRLDKALAALPLECLPYIEEALWRVYDPCLVGESAEKPLPSSYDSGVGCASKELILEHMEYARFGAYPGGLAAAVVECSLTARDKIRDSIMTKVGGEDQRHAVDFGRHCAFSSDERYGAFVTYPQVSDGMRKPHISVYDCESGSWRSIAFEAASAAFIDDHRMVGFSVVGFSLIDCTPADLSVQLIVSLPGRLVGRWSPCGEGIFYVAGKSITVYTPRKDGWAGIRCENHNLSRVCAVAKQRGVLACLSSSNDEGYVSFLKIVNDTYCSMSRIGIFSNYSKNYKSVRSDFFGKENLCAILLAKRNCVLVVSCEDLSNPQLIKKIYVSDSRDPVPIGHTIYLEGGVIMPNILLSYYAAYKKKLT